MNLPFSLPVTIISYAASWVFLHFACGFVAHLLPRSMFRSGGLLGRLFAERLWETAGTLYRHIGINRWKKRLPEAGALYAGGFDKRHVGAVTVEHLSRFQLETNRAEFSHWLTLISSLTFFAWNPWWVGLSMIAYGVITNLPFILVQRFNRPRLAALAVRTARAPQASTPRDSGGPRFWVSRAQRVGKVDDGEDPDDNSRAEQRSSVRQRPRRSPFSP